MRVPLISSILLTLGFAGAVHADTGTLPGGMTIKFNRILIHENGGDALLPPSNTIDATWKYFNLAHCQCDKANYGKESTDFKEGTFSWELIPVNSTQTVSRPATIWVGTDCDQILTRAMTCSRLDYAGISSIASIQQRSIATPELRLFDLMNPQPSAASGPCQSLQGISATEWFVADGDADGTDDYFASAAVTVDTAPPPSPTDWKAAGAEGAISVSWTNPADPSDIYAFQALCSKSDGNPPDGITVPAALYQTSTSLCSVPNDITLDPATIDTGDLGDVGTVTGAVDGLASLNPKFLCGTQTSSTATSMRIEGLANGQDYQVAILVIDKFGNAHGTYFTSLLRPVPSTDFWEDTHGRGSKVQGGLCSVGGVGGTTSGALLLGALAIVVVRRRRRVRGGGALVAALGVFVVVLGGARVASADDAGYDPGWNDPSNASNNYGGEEDSTVNWHAGLRIGPYTPQIDAQLGIMPGPYKAMFGGYSVMPMLDVERILWRGFGQLGIGGNIGFMSKKAHTWKDGSDPTDPMRPRATGDTNTFRLIPFAITGIYRFSVLDDLYGIPVVPYVKAGLAYDLWWMRGPNGDLSFTCSSGVAPNCTKNKAYGGTLGFQGTIGLAIRGERIDSNAAKQMHESGIQHAGFYGELQLAKVNGFGSDTKLSVGDNTWFAGVDFEF